ncbi:uncharacterized protein LOC131230763 [Magnolia sinica]|uniref:uncharacterized protein LOC131230763 n=1 Tax=Magnolia sinica TaxID=86752 RepID=UPI00265B6E1F|nr:uncharacterized protein LOC131230763 [Magnolia sinica]
MGRGITRNVAVCVALLTVIAYCLGSAAAHEAQEAHEHGKADPTWIDWAKDTFSGGFLDHGKATGEKVEEVAEKTKNAVSNAASGAANHVREKAGEAHAATVGDGTKN